jgi:hypothetical protein
MRPDARDYRVTLMFAQKLDEFTHGCSRYLAKHKAMIIASS